MLELERARCRRRDNFASVHAQRDGPSRRFGKEVTEILSEPHSRYLLERRVLRYAQNNNIDVQTLFFTWEILYQISSQMLSNDSFWVGLL